MIDWIIRNKEWLFSGAGVAVIIAIIGIARPIFSRRHRLTKQPVLVEEEHPLQQTDPAGAQARDPSIIGIPLNRILDDIESRPPFQRDDVKKHYIGTRLRFKGVLRFLSKRDNDKVYIAMRPPPNDWYPTVNFVVKVADYPQLKFVAEGTPMTVEGRIANLESTEATLEDVKIEW